MVALRKKKRKQKMSISKIDLNQFNLFFQFIFIYFLNFAHLLFCSNQVPNEVKQPVMILPKSDVTFPKNKNYFDIVEKYIYSFKIFFINTLE